MNCQSLLNNSPQWISCNDIAISGTPFCRSLNENSFDIEVLDGSNNQQINQFEGSAVGTTIPNLQPGTYTVNEIEDPTGNFTNQLAESADANTDCVNAGFAEGGSFSNNTITTFYRFLCFEYEDEQGNNCNSITLGAGEQKTCTVKNYINVAADF